MACTTMKISDEMREFVDENDLYPSQIAKLNDIAIRIGNEMVELPRDKDGKPIHCGEELWVDSADSYEKRFLLLMRLDGSGRWALLFEGGTMCDPSIVTHKNPDSLECIARELEGVADCGDLIEGEEMKLRELVGRIRRLAKRED